MRLFDSDVPATHSAASAQSRSGDRPSFNEAGEQVNTEPSDAIAKHKGGAKSASAYPSTSASSPARPESTPDPAPESASQSVPSSTEPSASDPTVAATADVTADATADDEGVGFLPVLKNQNFLALWGGQIFSQLADKVYLVLMIALISAHFQEPDQTISGWVSAIMIAFTIPAILFGSIAGVYVDRWPKQWVLVITNLVRGGLVLAIPVVLWLSQGLGELGGLPLGFYLLLSITFLVSTLTQFFAPAEQSAIPLIVRRHNLLSANSLYTTTMMASVIIGFAIGEPLLAIADQWLAPLGMSSDLGKELLVGGSYVIAGLILLLLQTDEQMQPHDKKAKVWADIRDGLRYLGKNTHVRSAIIQLVLLFSVFAALAVLAVRLAEVIPNLDSTQFGFLLAAGGVGMAIGAGLIGQFGEHLSRSQLSLIGVLGMTGVLGGLGFYYDRLIPSLVCIGLLGVFAALIGIPMQTTVQEETPESLRGKIFGLQNNAVNIALSLPLALAGVAETIWGLQAVLLGLAAIVFAGGGAAWYIADTGSAPAAGVDSPH